MLKEYWDTVARSQERLTQYKGVESVNVPNKNRNGGQKNCYGKMTAIIFSPCLLLVLGK